MTKYRMVGIGLVLGAVFWQTLWIGDVLVGINLAPSWSWIVFGFGMGMVTTPTEKVHEMTANAHTILDRVETAPSRLVAAYNRLWPDYNQGD